MRIKKQMIVFVCVALIHAQVQPLSAHFLAPPGIGVAGNNLNDTIPDAIDPPSSKRQNDYIKAKRKVVSKEEYAKAVAVTKAILEKTETQSNVVVRKALDVLAKTGAFSSGDHEQQKEIERIVDQLKGRSTLTQNYISLASAIKLELDRTSKEPIDSMREAILADPKGAGAFVMDALDNLPVESIGALLRDYCLSFDSWDEGLTDTIRDNPELKIEFARVADNIIDNLRKKYRKNGEVYMLGRIFEASSISGRHQKGLKTLQTILSGTPKTNQEIQFTILTIYIANLLIEQDNPKNYTAALKAIEDIHDLILFDAGFSAPVPPYTSKLGGLMDFVQYRLEVGMLYFRLVRKYHELRDFAQVLEMSRRAIALFKSIERESRKAQAKIIPMYAYQGDSFFELRRFSEALEAFKLTDSMLMAAPARDGKIAACYLAMGMHEKALQIIKGVHEKLPDDSQVIGVFGYALLARGTEKDTDRAYVILHEAQEKGQTSVSVQGGLIRVYIRRGDEDKALAIMKEAVQTSSSDIGLLYLDWFEEHLTRDELWGGYCSLKDEVGVLDWDILSVALERLKAHRGNAARMRRETDNLSTVISKLHAENHVDPLIQHAIRMAGCIADVSSEEALSDVCSTVRDVVTDSLDALESGPGDQVSSRTTKQPTRKKMVPYSWPDIETGQNFTISVAALIRLGDVEWVIDLLDKNLIRTKQDVLETLLDMLEGREETIRSAQIVDYVERKPPLVKNTTIKRRLMVVLKRRRQACISSAMDFLKTPDGMEPAEFIRRAATLSEQAHELALGKRKEIRALDVSISKTKGRLRELEEEVKRIASARASLKQFDSEIRAALSETEEIWSPKDYEGWFSRYQSVSSPLDNDSESRSMIDSLDSYLISEKKLVNGYADGCALRDRFVDCVGELEVALAAGERSQLELSAWWDEEQKPLTTFKTQLRMLVIQHRRSDPIFMVLMDEIRRTQGAIEGLLKTVEDRRSARYESARQSLTELRDETALLMKNPESASWDIIQSIYMNYLSLTVSEAKFIEEAEMLMLAGAIKVNLLAIGRYSIQVEAAKLHTVLAAIDDIHEVERMQILEESIQQIADNSNLILSNLPDGSDAEQIAAEFQRLADNLVAELDSAWDRIHQSDGSGQVHGFGILPMLWDGSVQTQDNLTPLISNNPLLIGGLVTGIAGLVLFTPSLREFISDIFNFLSHLVAGTIAAVKKSVEERRSVSEQAPPHVTWYGFSGTETSSYTTFVVESIDRSRGKSSTLEAGHTMGTSARSHIESLRPAATIMAENM